VLETGRFVNPCCTSSLLHSDVQSEKQGLGAALDEAQAQCKALQAELREARDREAVVAGTLAATRSSLEESRASLDDMSRRESAASDKVKELTASLQAAQVRLIYDADALFYFVS
jgi:septal ring factor EnvC (AmiA/AmiB activator)